MLMGIGRGREAGAPSSYTFGGASQAALNSFRMPFSANTETAGHKDPPSERGNLRCRLAATGRAARKTLGVRRMVLEMRNHRGRELA